MTLVKFKRPGYNHPTIFDEFFRDFWNESQQKGGSATSLPSTNIWEDKDKFNIELSAPGFTKEDIKIEVEDDIMTISGEHKTESKQTEKTFTRKEFNYGSFKRSFTLPENVDTESINAKYENGILKLELPKKETEVEKATKQIQVS